MNVAHFLISRIRAFFLDALPAHPSPVSARHPAILLCIACLAIVAAGCQERRVEDGDLRAMDMQNRMTSDAALVDADVEPADVTIPDPEGVAYRTGGERFAQVWHAFYDLGFHEPELDDPLIEAGAAMVPAICEAIRHKDMKRRVYALMALGFIGDRRSLPTLEAILADTAEASYVRSEALASIHLIDHALGVRHAHHLLEAEPELSSTARAVLEDAPWLRERSQDNHTGEDHT